MSTNQSLIKKADLVLADLVSNGGLLNPEQTDKFIQTLMEAPTITSSCRVVTMNAPQKKINKIGFGSRILQAATQGGQTPAAVRSKPDLGNVQLATKEVIAEVNIPYEVLEDNIEGGNINAGMESSAGGLEDTIVSLIAQRAALDLEELAILGDTASGDSYLALTDGFLKRATAHVVNAGAATISKDLFKNAIKAMPDKYLRVRGENTFFVSTDNETEYRDTVANRVTGLGDSALVSASSLAAFGSPVVAAPLMPNSKGVYTNPMNLIFGIQRKINIEFDKDIRARKFIIVVTARVDFQIEEGDAIVAMTNIG
jgi:HK97 family phage major capsid protein